MAAELHKHTQLSNMFDCPESVVTATEGVGAIKGDLVLVKDVWDASSLVEQQFQVHFHQMDTNLSDQTHISSVILTDNNHLMSSEQVTAAFPRLRCENTVMPFSLSISYAVHLQSSSRVNQTFLCR